MARRIEAVLFDLDDTLITWADAGGYWAAFRRERIGGVHAHLTAEGAALPDLDAFHAHVADHFVRSWDQAKRSHVAPRLDRALVEAATALGVARERLDEARLLAAYDWRPVPGVRPLDGALALLDALRAGGYRVGLVTNSMEPMWMRDIELAHYGLLDHFDVRLSAADVGVIKPHPAIFAAALDALDLPGEAAMFVGDRPINDVAGAQRAGMVGVLMECAHYAQVGREEVAPDHTIAALDELHEILAGYGGPPVPAGDAAPAASQAPPPR